MTIQNLIRVMIVDDHDVVRRGLSMFLSGFDDLLLVGEAANGIDAIRLCTELQPHVVLMDMVMPEMGGPELARIITESHPRMKVVFMSGYLDMPTLQRRGADAEVDYLQKPFASCQLSTTLLSMYISILPVIRLYTNLKS